MKKIFERLVTIALLLVAVNMDTQSGKRSVDLEPSFAPLQAGQGSFMAVVHDGSMAVEVEDLSFFGHTSLGHVKSEDNDSVCEFDLAEITTLEVIQPHFDSSKFSDQVFTKISITTLSQAAEKSNDAPKTRTVENLLVPRNIIVCGKERSTGIKRAWFISKINKIVVQHADIDKKIAFIAKKNARSKNSHQKKDDASLPKESDYHQ